MSKEVWKPVVGYKGLYEVSSLGRLKSLNHRGNTKKAVVMKPFVMPGEYPYHKYSISKNGVVRTILIHWLVMEAFEGQANGRKIDHRDGYSNEYSNLRYCTHRQNLTFTNVRFKKKRSSKYPGVSYNLNSNGKNKWRAIIQIDKNKFSLGTFATEESAAEAYQNKLKEI